MFLPGSQVICQLTGTDINDPGTNTLIVTHLVKVLPQSLVNTKWYDSLDKLGSFEKEINVDTSGKVGLHFSDTWPKSHVTVS